STVPMLDHTSATRNTAAMDAETARPVGEGGVSTISSAAGRNASSSRLRVGLCNEALIRLAHVMDARLHARQGRLWTAAPDQLLVRPVLDEAAALDGDDAVGRAHRRQAVGDDQHRPAGGDLPHVLLDHALALIVERTGRLVEDEDAGIG